MGGWVIWCGWLGVGVSVLSARWLSSLWQAKTLLARSGGLNGFY